MADPGALSSNATPPQPPGALYGQPNTLDTIGDTLQGMGAGLASIYNPSAASQMMNAISAKRQMQYEQNKPQLVETGQDPFTNQKSFAMFLPSTRSLINFGLNGQVVGGGSGSGSASMQSFDQLNAAKTAGAPTDQLYQMVPSIIRNDVQALVEGTGMPTNYARGGQTKNLLDFYAHTIGDGQNGRPLYDPTKLAGRIGLNSALENPKTGNVGGQVNAVRTMFDHMAGQVAPAMVAQDNSEGGGSVDAARLINGTKNRFGDNPAKAAALSDAVDTLTGEKGKYYYGQSGGGVEERQATRMRFNPNDPPSVQAATLETERDLALAKQGEMQTQIDEAKGKGKYQVMGPEELKSLDTINKQISILKARAAGVTEPSSPAQSAPQAPVMPKVGEVRQGYSFKGGNPADPNSWEKQ